ncbi:MAG TPA: hypothetical protein VJV05_05555 [Pyrinomonadaceae bacterium]|nr:hypothetical protein [Pyrinomonadaceae bacterium]
MKILCSVILVFTFVAAAAAQNTIKLFDANNIGITDPIAMASAIPWGSYRTAEVYLTCQSGQAPNSWVTGPNGGGFIVDDVMGINGRNACGGYCFSTNSTPENFIGQPAEAAYLPVGPFQENHIITGSGLYTFHLYDIGYVYASTEVYLNTSCQITPVNVPEQTGTATLCHRNSGSKSVKTISVETGSVPAHLAHGDTLGACGQ